MSRADALDRTLAALADPARRSVIELLRKRPRRSGELAAQLELSAPAMSRHLRALRDAGLVALQPLGDDGRARLYQLQPGPLAALRSWLGS